MNIFLTNKLLTKIIFDMYLIKVLYLSIILISCVCFFLLFKVTKKNPDACYVVLFTSVIFQCLGYLKLYFANNLETIIFANQVIYLGGCILPFVCIKCLQALCKEKLNSFLNFIFISVALIIFAGSCTIGKNGLYYKSIDFVKGPLCNIIIKEYGPLHFLYPVYLISSISCSFIILTKCYTRKKHISYLTGKLLSLSTTSVAFFYFFERIFHLQFELLPVSFMIMQIAVLFLLYRINQYDLWRISSASLEENQEMGFIVLNSNGVLYATDKISLTWFPELKESKIDKKIENTGSDFLQLINKWISNPEFDKSYFFDRDGKIIQVKLNLSEKKRRFSNYCIYCILMRDDTQQQNFARLMKEYNSTLEQQVDEKTAQLKKVQNDIIISMASIVENRDSNTGGHIKRTSDVVKIFVENLVKTNRYPQLTKKFSECVIKAAPLHDFGKIGIPDLILNKPGKFEPNEYEIMKQHSEKGSIIVAEILRNSNDSQFRDIAINVAHYHHEKWDGTGYPSKLAGKEIPFEARIMALADVFDALVSKRVYKESFSYEKAFSIIEECKGSHFDPDLCQEFILCRPQLESIYNSYKD